MDRGAVIGKSAVAVVALAAAGALSAVEYSVKPYGAVQYSHDDNFRLIPDNEFVRQGRSLWGETYSAGALAAASEQNWALSLDLDLEFERFNQEDFDSDNQFATFNWNWRTEKQLWDLKIDLDRDSIRSSTVEDTGIVVAGRSEIYSVNPTWQYYFTERAYAGITGNWSTGKYDDEFNQLVGYDYNQGEVFTGYAVNEQLTLNAYALGSRYQSEENELFGFVYNPFAIGGPATFPFQQNYVTETKTRGFGLGFDYRFNETLTTSFSAGRQRNTTEYLDIEDVNGLCPGLESNPFLISLTSNLCEPFEGDGKLTIYSASVDWQGERQTISASYDDRDKPSSNGYLQKTKTFRFDWRYNFTEKQNLKLELLWIETDVDSDNVLAADRGTRDYGSARLRYGYQIFQDWWLSLSYQYRTQDRESYTEKAESHVGYASINYRPKKWLW